MQLNQDPAGLPEREADDLPFTVHWSPIKSPVARRYASEGSELFALWPAPVNADECFAEAGFRDFGDAHPTWEQNADGVLTRLLLELGNYGTPRLITSPLPQPQSWLRRWFARAEILALREQIELPMHWDNLPDCVVEFGASKATLRTGKGHQIYWIALPEKEATAFEKIAGRVAAAHPLLQTELRWEHLIR